MICVWLGFGHNAETWSLFLGMLGVLRECIATAAPEENKTWPNCHKDEWLGTKKRNLVLTKGAFHLNPDLFRH